MEAHSSRHEIYHEEASTEQEHSYEVMRSPGMRAEYVRLTDELIQKLVSKDTDVAIFLDKSARPVAWMVNELWDVLAPANSPPKPAIKFLNIDREQWGAILGRSEDKEGGIDVSNLPVQRIHELHKLYGPVATVSEKGDQSLLTDKNVLIVDEVRMSGDTLKMSEEILRAAFPDARDIDGTYWMHGQVKRDSGSGTLVGKNLPIWYSDREVTGRLVGNRDTNKSMQSNSYRQRVGRYWLSAPFREPDYKGRQLKQEVSWIKQDLLDHKLIYIPSPSWEGVDPIAERIQRINGISQEEFAGLRRLTDDNDELVQAYKDYLEARRAYRLT